MAAVRLKPAGLAALARYIERVHDSVTDDVADDARAGCPVSTGRTRASIHARKVGSLVSEVVAGGHWREIEYGTPPHVIEPSRKRALFWPGAAHPVRVVEHPGTEAQPFLRPAIYRRRSLAGRPGR